MRYSIPSVINNFILVMLFFGWIFGASSIWNCNLAIIYYYPKKLWQMSIYNMLNDMGKTHKLIYLKIETLNVILNLQYSNDEYMTY